MHVLRIGERKGADLILFSRAFKVTFLNHPQRVTHAGVYCMPCS
jgi:hypothetical protein